MAGGKRLAVYVALNLETFDFGSGLGAELAPGGPQPDVLNYAWRDWGNRVGAFRMKALFDELRLPASVLVNSRLYEDCPGLIEAFRARGDEIVGHGRTNAERQGNLEEEAERALIAEATATLTREEGKPPPDGSAPGSRNHASRPISWRRRATGISSTGRMTTSRSGSPPATAVASSPCRIHRNSTTSPPSSRGRTPPGTSPP